MILDHVLNIITLIIEGVDTQVLLSTKPVKDDLMHDDFLAAAVQARDPKIISM